MRNPEHKWIELRNLTARSADLFLYEAIGSTDSAADTLAQLRALDVKTINVRINSPGGHVFGGFAIYNTLAALEAEIVVYVDGLAASIASVIAMAGDRIVMAQNAVMMIHSPSGAVEGGADAMRSSAGLLDKLTASLADIYAARSGLARPKIAELMAADSWLTADECLALGLCTSIVPSHEMAASIDLSAFQNVPAAVLARATAAPTTAQIFERYRAICRNGSNDREAFFEKHKIQLWDHAASIA